MIRRASIGALVAAIALSVAPATFATHADPNQETGSAFNNRCDKWYRANHETGTGAAKTSHGDTSNSDVNPEATIKTVVPQFDDPADNYIHSHGGHHVVRNRYGYLEVIGGQSYRGPDPNGNSFPGQGGVVQGEIDVVQGAPDIEFSVAYFGPNVDSPPAANAAAIQNWVNGQYLRVCVDSSGERVEQQSRNP